MCLDNLEKVINKGSQVAESKKTQSDFFLVGFG
jgi:hypothetical protein